MSPSARRRARSSFPVMSLMTCALAWASVRPEDARAQAPRAGGTLESTYERAPGLTEEAFVARVLASSPEARLLEAEWEADRAEGAELGVYPNPSVEWEREPNPTETRVVGGQHVLRASLPLVLSGRLGLESEAAARADEASDARRARARANLRREAKRAFVAVLAARERRAVLERARAALEELAPLHAPREKAGEAAGVERARLAMERALLEDAFRSARLEQHQALLSAARLIGATEEVLPALEGELGHTPPEVEAALRGATALAAAVSPRGAEEGRELTPVRNRPASPPEHSTSGAAEKERRSREDAERALASRADVRAWALDAESERLLGKAAARGIIPDPSLMAGALLLEGSEPHYRAGLVIGVSVPLPVFDVAQGARAQARTRQALAERRREQLLAATRLELAEAAEVRAATQERLERHAGDVSRHAAELRAIARAAFQRGAADVSELIEAERTAREAELLGLELKLALEQAKIELLFLSGAFDAADAPLQGATGG